LRQGTLTCEVEERLRGGVEAAEVRDERVWEMSL